MCVSTLRAQLLQRMIEHEQVVPVLPTRTCASRDVLRQGLWLLHADKLGITRQADVDETFHRGNRRIVRDEGCELNAVAVDLADVEIVLHLWDVGCGNSVGRAPDFVLGDCVLRLFDQT